MYHTVLWDKRLYNRADYEYEITYACDGCWSLKVKPFLVFRAIENNLFIEI